MGGEGGDETFNLKGSPGTICTSDARAMDFSHQIEHIPSGTLEVCATIKTFAQISTPETICIAVAGKNISNSTLNNRWSRFIILSLFIFIRIYQKVFPESSKQFESHYLWLFTYKEEQNKHNISLTIFNGLN